MDYRPEPLDVGLMNVDELIAMAKIGLWFVSNGYLIDDDGARSDPFVQECVDELEELDWEITFTTEE